MLMKQPSRVFIKTAMVTGDPSSSTIVGPVKPATTLQ